ncbi:MAG: HEAT repeat domain-containing protein [Methanolobus sp.]|nr:HEAT repeat domain-containing protein [Methanolobus sp.]
MKRAHESVLRNVAILLLATLFVSFGLVSGVCASGESVQMDEDNIQISEDSSILSSIMRYFGLLVYDDQDKNVTRWIEILVNRSEIEENRSYATYMLGDSGDSRAAKPFLIIIEDTEESDSLRQSVTGNLGKVGNKKHTDILIEMLDDNLLDISSAVSLGYLGDKKAVEPLMNILANESMSENMRQAAARSLGQIGDKRAVKLLIECLEDESQYIQSEAAWALGETGDERAIEPLADLLDKEYEFAVTNSAEALNKLGAPVEDMLIENLDHQDINVRKNSIYALSSIGEQSSYSVFLKIAEDRTEYEEVRRAAISALGRSDDDDLIEPLTDILKNENEKRNVRAIVPRTLIDIDEEKAIKILIKDIKIKDTEVRASIVSSFRKLEGDKEKIPMVIEPVAYLLLNDAQWPVRKQAAIVMADIAGENASGHLSLALNDENPEVRSIAAMHLAYMADENSTEHLINALENETNKYTRGYMTRALARTNDSNAVPILVQLMQDREEYLNVRITAAEGLGVHKDDNVTKALIEVLESKDDSPDLRRTAVISLGNINNPAAVNILSRVEADRDEHPRIRKSVRHALENIQEVEVS